MLQDDCLTFAKVELWIAANLSAEALSAANIGWKLPVAVFEPSCLLIFKYT